MDYKMNQKQMQIIAILASTCLSLKDILHQPKYKDVGIDSEVVAEMFDIIGHLLTTTISTEDPKRWREALEEAKAIVRRMGKMGDDIIVPKPESA